MDGVIMKCGFCGHACSRTYSDYPPSGTARENVTYSIASQRGAMCCSNCNKFTILVGSTEEGELKLKQFKRKDGL